MKCFAFYNVIELESNVIELNYAWEKKYKKSIEDNVKADYRIKIVFDVATKDYVARLNPLFGNKNRYSCVFENNKCTIIRVKDNEFILKVMNSNETTIFFNCNGQLEFIEDCTEMAILNYVQHKIEGFILHSSCIKCNDSTIIFSGSSGSGKSTLAMLAYLMNYQIIENECLVINMSPSVCLGGVSQNIALKEEGMRNLAEYLGNDVYFDFPAHCAGNDSIQPKSISIILLNYTTDTGKFLEEVKYTDIIRELAQQVIVPEGYFPVNKVKVFESFYKFMRKVNCFRGNLEKNNIKKSESILKVLVNKYV